MGWYFSRPGRLGPADTRLRTPELAPLEAKTISLFGLGSLGAPSALEFARAGVGKLRVLDFDYVDPGTITRWPFGLQAAGVLKVDVIRSFIHANYPSTEVLPVQQRLGSARFHPQIPSDLDAISTMITGTSLIYDATAELAVQQYLSDLAREQRIPYVGVVGMQGGWGGKVYCIDPGRTEGCWLCYRYHWEDESIPDPPSDPAGEIRPVGCGDVTFTGTGFDMTEVALSGVRAAISTLCAGSNGSYPKTSWDVLTIAFRDGDGKLIPPKFQGYELKRHPKCPLHAQ